MRSLSLVLPRTLGDAFLSAVARKTTVKLPANQNGPREADQLVACLRLTFSKKGNSGKSPFFQLLV